MHEKLFRESRSQFQKPDLFDRARNHAVNYMTRVHGPAEGQSPLPVYPPAISLENLGQFTEPLPQGPGDPEAILDLLHAAGSPAAVAQTGGRYFGFVNGSAFPVALAAKWLADVWDQNAAMYVTSPVAAQLETVCQSWLRELFSLPETTVSGFVSGTSTATFCGLAAARNQLLLNMGWDLWENGLFNAPRPRVILGAQAHSTVFKALALLGFGRENLEILPCDDQGRMRTEAMPDTDHTCMVIAQAGNVCTGAFDDFTGIRDRAPRAWIHIDGAFGLWAAASPAHAPLASGMELADSWSVDAHKTLNAPYDCGIILCRHPQALVDALQNSGDYIVYSRERDPMMYTQEMSRRARGIELWATLKYLGRSGVGDLVGHLCKRAGQMASLLRQAEFTILNDVVFNQVLVSCPEPDKNPALLAALQSEGVCWCGGTTWQGRPAIRISVCSWATTAEDIEVSAAALVRARDKVRTDSGGSDRTVNKG